MAHGLDGGGGVRRGGGGVPRPAGHQVDQRPGAGGAEAVRHPHRAGHGGGERPPPVRGSGHRRQREPAEPYIYVLMAFFSSGSACPQTRFPQKTPLSVL